MIERYCRSSYRATYRYVLCTNNVDDCDEVNGYIDVDCDGDGEGDSGEDCDEDGVEDLHCGAGDNV